MANLSVVAKPYAKASFEFANENNLLKEWSLLLGVFSELVSSADIVNTINSPELSQTDVVKSLKDLVDVNFYNFIALLAKNNKLEILPAIAERFEIISDEHNNSCTAEVTIAYKADKKLLESLQKRLEARFGSSVSMNVNIDPSIIGGAIIKVGGSVIDDSVSGRIEKLKNILLS
jgi:F-type H+-transporting ATPase subunit delta